MGIPDEPFWAPEDVVSAYRAHAAARGTEARQAWEKRLAEWDGDRAAWDAAWAGTGLPGWEAGLPTFAAGETLATRQALQKVLAASRDTVPGLMVGAADLTGNTGAKLEGARAAVGGAPGWPADLLRHPGARHGRMPGRHGLPRRGHPRRRDVLRLQRLHPADACGSRP